jgi:hypothetical protein
MHYFSISLYGKMLHCAMAEGMTEEEFLDYPIPLSATVEHQAIPAEEFFETHERLDKRLGPGFYFVRNGDESLPLIIQD